jgi:hypothetical protein
MNFKDYLKAAKKQLQGNAPYPEVRIDDVLNLAHENMLRDLAEVPFKAKGFSFIVLTEDKPDRWEHFRRNAGRS